MLVLNLGLQFTEKYFKLPYSDGALKDVEFLVQFVGQKEQSESRAKWFKNSKTGNMLDGMDITVMSSERSRLAGSALVGWKNIKSTDGADVPYSPENKKLIVDRLFTLPVEKTNENDVTDSNTLQSWVFGICTNFNNFVSDASNLLTS